MANLIPYVEPAVNSVGNPISTAPRIIFGQAIDSGIATSSNFFIVRISTEGQEGIEDYLQDVNIVSDIIPASVSYKRINLADNDEFTGLDYGDTGSAGQLYRSEITITPNQPLGPNYNFAVILSKNISLLTTFDPKPDTGNSGSGSITTQGVYQGLTADTYTVTVVASGGKYSSQYVWTRASDSQSSLALQASGKWTEIDRGIKLKFLDGSYDIGDTFTIEVIPKDEQVEIFSWNFSTGLGEYKVPEDERSGDIVNLPTIDPNQDTITTPAETFGVESISPDFATTNVRTAKNGFVVIGSVIFRTKEPSAARNGLKISYVSGGLAGSEVITINGNDVEIAIEDEVSTAQQIIDAFNTSALNVDMEAVTSSPSVAQKAGPSGRIVNGVNPNTIEITFKDNVEASSVTDKIRVTSQPIFPAGEEKDLYFSTQVVDNKVILTLLD